MPHPISIASASDQALFGVRGEFVMQPEQCSINAVLYQKRNYHLMITNRLLADDHGEITILHFYAHQQYRAIEKPAQELRKSRSYGSTVEIAFVSAMLRLGMLKHPICVKCVL
uniref:Uncharacterized protein n=1 Tax=Anopheles culicifacies TaxID=139723 RepID=A0A182MEM9_9DIPT